MRRKIGYFLFAWLIMTMNVALAVWDTTTPTGNEAKSLGDDRIRELKTDVQTSLQYEGDFPGTDTSNPRFIYTPSTGTTALRPTGNAAPAGRLYINLSSGTLEMSQGNGSWNALDVVGSSTITGGDLAVSVAGDGLTGGGGNPLAVNYDDSLFGIITDSITIDANSIGSTQIADSVTIPTLAVTTQTWNGFGVMPILQYSNFNTSTSSNTTGTTFVDSTVKTTINRKDTDSIFLIIVSGTFTQGVGADGYITIARNGSNLGGTYGKQAIISNNTDAVALHIIDSFSGSSGDSIVYSAQIRSGSGGIQAIFPTNAGSGTPEATISVIEMGQ